MSSFAMDWYPAALIMFIGLYCMLASRTLLRRLVGLAMISKAAMLALISAGALANDLPLAQALIIILILAEAAVMAAGAALLARNLRAGDSADIRSLNRLKG